MRRDGTRRAGRAVLSAAARSAAAGCAAKRLAAARLAIARFAVARFAMARLAVDRFAMARLAVDRFAAARFARARLAAAASAAAIGAASLLAGTFALAADTSVPTFDAHYTVEYKGRRVGKMDLSVRYDEARDRYHFESRTQATGVLKVVRPKATVQTTDFVLHDGAIRPLEFRLDDGTRKGEDDRHIVFDWERGTATITSDDGTSELPLEPDLLDGGTILVALMLDLEHDEAPGPYKYTDGDAPSTYDYTNQGPERLEVEAGTFDAAVIKQQHEGSSRHTLFWAVPKLSYLPAKIAQYKDGELVTAMTLDSVEGLDSATAH